MASHSASVSSGPVRAASHAGSWYSGSGRELAAQLDGWLSRVGPPAHGPARALIAPHAGYSYCGPTAAHAYAQVDPTRVRRVFILGPSHHFCLSGCALSSCSRYATPIADLLLDQSVNGDLLATGEFETMDLKTDEAEHSIEMHLPYIAKLMTGRAFTIVPVLVGSLSLARQSDYGRIFARYLADPANLFVISSDFCHWGHRFRFSPHDRNAPDPIWEQIERLDREGMAIIERMEPGAWADYLKRTQNTICGRHPISVMLQAAEHFRQANNHSAALRFLHYAQSNKVRTPGDSSVSYAAAALTIHPKGP